VSCRDPSGSTMGEVAETLATARTSPSGVVNSYSEIRVDTGLYTSSVGSKTWKVTAPRLLQAPASAVTTHHVARDRALRALIQLPTLSQPPEQKGAHHCNDYAASTIIEDRDGSRRSRRERGGEGRGASASRGLRSLPPSQAPVARRHGRDLPGQAGRDSG